MWVCRTDPKELCLKVYLQCDEGSTSRGTVAPSLTAN